MINLERFSCDIRKYVNFLEQLIMDTLYEFNIITHRWDKAIGVWTYKSITSKKIIKKERQKIASIGIRVRKKISFHGISVNIYPNLNFFDKIVLFNNREIIMHNNVYNTSSSFNIISDQWTSFNENYIDTYKCVKKRH